MIQLFPCLITIDCVAPLGMENGAISDAQITASSRWSDNHSPLRARLNTQETGDKKGAWSVANYKDNQKQWLQVDLGNYTTVTRVATQGRNGYRPKQWVKKYKIEYSNNEVKWTFYQEPGDSSAKVFLQRKLFSQLGKVVAARERHSGIFFWMGLCHPELQI